MTSELVPRPEGTPDKRGMAVGVGARVADRHTIDDVAHLDRVLMAELSALNARLARYVLRFFDVDSGSAEPISVADERALADSVATAADAIRVRAERRQWQEVATARRRYAEAIGYAKRAHHPLLTAYMTASLGHVAVETGDSNQGLTLLLRASQQLDGGAPDTARAWMASLLAVAYACTGDRKQTLAELRRAENLTAQQVGEPQWPWVFPFSSAKAARYRASALGRLGDLRAVRTAYAAAGPALTAAKPRALAQVEQARVLASTGDVAGGCSLATEALAVGRAYGSERITSRVREFRASIAMHTAEARQLDDALATLYEREDV